MNTAVISKNTKRVRHERGLTQLDVAKKADISLPAFSKIESGKSSPRMDTLYKIAGAMGVGVQELLSPVRELSAVRFRAQKKLKRRDHILARVSKWLEDFNYLLGEQKQKAAYTLAGLPEELRGVPQKRRPVQAAELVRERMGLSAKEPIHDITGLLAANGIKVLPYELASDGFFGMSVGQADGGPAIVVNVWDRIPVERWIFSAAHELGHLVMHLDAYNVDIVAEDEKQEQEANQFASHFLMPQKGFDQEWQETYGLGPWDRILKVKRIFHVSYKAVIFRLIEQGVLKKTVWSQIPSILKQKYPGKESKSFEPDGLKQSDFVTDWLERLVRVGVEKEQITQSRAGEILDVPLPEMRKRIASWAEEKSGNRLEAVSHS
jgi:Zn-dependent peptidase ImmA (M78 family)/DNA-binding XRE family transcriptional regulator